MPFVIYTADLANDINIKMVVIIAALLMKVSHMPKHLINHFTRCFYPHTEPVKQVLLSSLYK